MFVIHTKNQPLDISHLVATLCQHLYQKSSEVTPFYGYKNKKEKKQKTNNTNLLKL